MKCLKEKILKILHFVLKPTRYINNELNSCHKTINKDCIKIALAFPDIYEVGMSYLGFKILYEILNQEENIVAERIYAPWIDMEKMMRDQNIPLFSLESYSPLTEFDIIGFTLQYELSYTNILNMLDLAKIPLLSKERDKTFPLIIAGGPCAFNPEPLASFIDCFLIGDGEEAILEIVNCFEKWKNENQTKEDLLINLTKIKGIYVPCFYQPQGPVKNDIPSKIEKRIITDFGKAITKPIVPYMETIHNRAVLEIMRGCVRGCRFCQAGIITRPKRERNLQNLVQSADIILKNTGYDEISLLSLNTADYSNLEELVLILSNKYAKDRISISFPSLRSDSIISPYLNEIKKVRKTGFTFAPEAGSQRLRNVINKGVTEEDLITNITQLFKAGWKNVKLYFMIGLPTETDKDIEEIITLVKKLSYINRNKVITVNISNFVPKPHTSFQWEPQDLLWKLKEKQNFLIRNLKSRNVNVKYNPVELSLLEAVFSRGNRNLDKVLLSAHKKGAKFDQWSEVFNFDLWIQAFKETGIDYQDYANKKYEFEDILPWDHILSGVKKEFLINENKKAKNEQITPACDKYHCYNCGCNCITKENLPKLENIEKFYINNDFNNQKVQRIRAKFKKTDEYIFLSHLDLVRLFTRVIRQTNIPIAYSKGFNPHPKIIFGPPLSVGIISLSEYVDFYLTSKIQNFMERLNIFLPDGIKILEIKEIPIQQDALSKLINLAHYQIKLKNVCKNIEEIMKQTEIFITHSKKGKLNIKPYIFKMWLENNKLNLFIKITPYGTIKVDDILKQVLNIKEFCEITRMEMYHYNNNNFISVFEL